MILQNLDALKKDLKSDTARPYYLVLGPEMYQCRLAVDLIKSRFLDPEAASFDYGTFSARDTTVERILETANTFPMMAKRRFVLVTELEKLAETEHDKLLASLDSILPSSVLVFIAEELDHRKKLYKTIRDKGCVAEFSNLKGAALTRWVEAFIREKGYRISSELAEKVVNLAGSDLQSLASELEKLFLFTGEEKQITDRAVDDLVRNSRQHGIFELIDAVGKRDRAGALFSLANLLSMGEHPLVIVTMMARHSRQVLIVKECIQSGMNYRDAGETAHIPPFILDKFIRQAKSMEMDTVRRMHLDLSDIDRKLKSSAVEARMLLEVFICALV